MREWMSRAALILTALIWGTAFVAQSVGMEYVGPFTFQATRSLLGSAALVPVILVMDRIRGGSGQKKTSPQSGQKLLMSGLLCGLVMCIASNLQQVGIQYTTVGKAGFLTALYMVMVPIFGIFLHRRPSRRVWICVFVSLLGVYFLSGTENFRLSAGDSLILLCAVFFAVHILIVDRVVQEVDGVKLSCIQFFVSGVISGVLMFLFEKPDPANILAGGASIFYAGVMSCGIAYTLQIVGQKYTDPTLATLLLSMESVFSLLGGMVLLGQIPSAREALGCALVFGAVVAAQLPEKRSGGGQD